MGSKTSHPSTQRSRTLSQLRFLINAFAYHFTPSTVYLLPVAATFLSLPLVFRGCSLSRPSSSWQDEPTRPSEEYSHVLHRLFLPLHSSSISLLCSPLDRRAHTPLYCSAPLPPSLSQHPGWCAHAACAQQVRNMQSPSLTARTDSSDQARSQALGKIYLTRLAAIQSQSANWIWSIVYCVRFWTGLFFFIFFFCIYTHHIQSAKSDIHETVNTSALSTFTTGASQTQSGPIS